MSKNRIVNHTHANGISGHYPRFFASSKLEFFEEGADKNDFVRSEKPE